MQRRSGEAVSNVARMILSSLVIRMRDLRFSYNSMGFVTRVHAANQLRYLVCIRQGAPG